MLNKKESIILCLLRKDARRSLADMSSKTGMPIATIYKLANKLQTKGLVDKYGILLDFQKLGFGIRVNLAFKTNKKSNLKSFLSRHPNINSIHKVSKEYDFLVDAIFKNFSEYESFKEALEEFDISKINEHHILEEIKREEAFLS